MPLAGHIGGAKTLLGLYKPEHSAAKRQILETTAL